MPHFTMLNLPTFTDQRGSLTVLEKALPFEVVRTYWIYGADGQTRGGHRHTYTSQALVALSGKVSMYMNDGVTEENLVPGWYRTIDVALATSSPVRSSIRLSIPAVGLGIQGKSWW